MNDDYELILFDRLNVIKDTINKYGEDNFYISFSGGKDSTVLHYLIDMALPNNQIPRVYANTGIEYQDIVKYVKDFASKDNRFLILNPTKNVKTMLEEVGYPFKSKDHSYKLMYYKKGCRLPYVMNYLNGYEEKSRFACPDILKYQFSEDFKLKISDRCCFEMKKKPFHHYEKASNKSICVTGMRKEEGGQRTALNCIITKKGKVVKFHPLSVVSEDWEEWFIEKYNIKLCRLYYPPFSFKRTGCKGCPYSLTLYQDLETMRLLLPNERKQCEIIWKPVYEEYRRLRYRLKKDEQTRLF